LLLQKAHLTGELSLETEFFRFKIFVVEINRVSQRLFYLTFAAHDDLAGVLRLDSPSGEAARHPLCEQPFEFSLRDLPTALLVFANELGALQLLDRVAQDDILKLQRLRFYAPCLDFAVCELELAVESVDSLLKGVKVARHVHALFSEKRDRIFKHPDLLIFLHVEVVVCGLLFELGQLLLDAQHVVFVAQHEVRLVLLDDCRVQRVELEHQGVAAFVGLHYFIVFVVQCVLGKGPLHKIDGALCGGLRL